VKIRGVTFDADEDGAAREVSAHDGERLGGDDRVESFAEQLREQAHRAERLGAEEVSVGRAAGGGRGRRL
jgi:hypothetical protein